MTVNVLGTEYTVMLKAYDDDESFKKRNCDGYCEDLTKRIVICDMHTCEGWEDASEESVIQAQKRILRHEIVHAFFAESGLDSNASVPSVPWSLNEEMVDWIAIQGPKIHKAWEEADAT